ncbi:MAG: hypothetical protein H6741_13520 [Alphaproteobacteria bacterium]|nr:hypothetical protein [Alphaproteobacteria bacterium]
MLPGMYDDPIDALQDWIEEHHDQLDLDDPERIRTARYLHDTRHIELDEDERLRWLAAWVEAELPPAVAWPAARRILEQALERFPDSIVVLDTLGTTATLLVDALPEPRRAEVLAVGERAIRRAITLNPEEPRHFQILHLLRLADGDAEGALEAARAGVSLGDAGVNQLHVAGALHALGRWEDAIVAYGAVVPDEELECGAWNLELHREQWAECALQLGDPEAARREVDRLLTLYAEEPERALSAMGPALDRCCAALGGAYPARLAKLRAEVEAPLA